MSCMRSANFVLSPAKRPACTCFYSSSRHTTSDNSSRRSVRLAAAAQAAKATQQQQQHAQALSAILLLCENIKRQTGCVLLQRDQMLKGVELVDAAEYACMVLGSSSSGSSSSSSSNDANRGAACPLLYANQTARDVLAQQQQHQNEKQQQQQQLSVPAVVDILQPLPQKQQQMQQSQQQQQHPNFCRVLADVKWPCSVPFQQQQQQQHLELCIPQLLCVPMQSPNDAPFGLALMFDSWEWSNGAVGVPGWPYVLPSDIPDDAALQAVADAVRQQADAVRALKTKQGLGNKDPAVVAAVAQLQSLKEGLTRAEGLQAAFADGRQSQLHPLRQAVLLQQQQQQQQ